MLMVIAGISSVGSPIFVGIFLGSPLTTKIFPSFAKWQNMLIGFAGVGLGKNPNGFTADLRPASAQVKRDLPVLIGLIVVLVGIWRLRIGDLFSNGPYLVLSLVALAAAPAVAARRRGGAGAELEPDESAAGTAHTLVGGSTGHARDRGLHAPPELLGLGQPFTPADVAVLDEAIDIVAAERRLGAEIDA